MLARWPFWGTEALLFSVHLKNETGNYICIFCGVACNEQEGLIELSVGGTASAKESVHEATSLSGMPGHCNRVCVCVSKRMPIQFTRDLWGEIWRGRWIEVRLLTFHLDLLLKSGFIFSG